MARRSRQALKVFERWANRPWGEPWGSDAALLAWADGITEIGLSRDMCFGQCPVYAFTLHRNGQAEFLGEYFVALMGSHGATFDATEFIDLARVVAYLGYESMGIEFEEFVTDQATTWTWVRRGEDEKRVRNYGDAGPRELAVIENLIDDFASRLSWQPLPTELNPKTGLPIFVGSTLGASDLPIEYPGEPVHWTQRPAWLRQRPES